MLYIWVLSPFLFMQSLCPLPQVAKFFHLLVKNNTHSYYGINVQHAAWVYGVVILTPRLLQSHWPAANFGRRNGILAGVTRRNSPRDYGWLARLGWSMVLHIVNLPSLPQIDYVLYSFTKANKESKFSVQSSQPSTKETFSILSNVSKSLKASPNMALTNTYLLSFVTIVITRVVTLSYVHVVTLWWNQAHDTIGVNTLFFCSEKYEKYIRRSCVLGSCSTSFSILPPRASQTDTQTHRTNCTT